MAKTEVKYIGKVPFEKKGCGKGAKGKKNLQAEADKLREKGFTARVIKTKRANKAGDEVHCMYVGPRSKKRGRKSAPRSASSRKSTARNNRRTTRSKSK